MSYSNSFNIGADNLILGSATGIVNIKSLGGEDILINGVLPGGGGGGGGVPAIGDIDFIGNLNCNDVPGGGSKGIITAEKKVISGLGGLETSGNIEITSNGNLTLNGNGTILQLGGGKITSGSGGIESTGDITTIGAHDLIIGKDIYFDGLDIYHRTVNPNAQESYKDFKQLPGKNDANIYTGSNKFRSSALSIQALNDAVPPVYADTITFNTNGNIQCKNINNVLEITTGTVVCDNGGTNECKARVFNTRTSGVDGWHIKQALKDDNPPNNQANNILQIAATQAQAAGIPVEVYITSSEYNPSNGDNPNIKLIPDTILNGGTIQAAQFELGTASNRFYLKQDIGGPNDQVLQIKARTAGASVNFKDNSNNDILLVKNTEIELGTNISIKFDNYSFRPIELTYAFTGATLDNNPPTLFNSLTTDFIRTNDGVTNVKLNDLGEGIYILSIDAGSSSSPTTIGSSRFMCNFPYMVSANASGSFSFSGNFCINTTPPAGFIEPTIEGDGTGGPVGSTNYSFVFSSITSAETFNGIVKITRLSY
jgi:hypothetical protein